MSKNRKIFLKSLENLSGYGVEIIYNNKQLRQFSKEHNLPYYPDNIHKNTYRIIHTNGRTENYNSGLNTCHNYPLLLQYSYHIEEYGSHYDLFMSYNNEQNKSIIDKVFYEKLI